MKLISVLKGITLNTAKPNKPLGFLPDMIAELAREYKFQEIPTDISKLIVHGDKPPESPAIFRHGKVVLDGRSLVIEELQVFANGTIVSTPSSTTDSDSITEHVFVFASSKFGLEFQPLRPLLHSSQLEIRFCRPLPELLSPLKQIGQAVNAGLDKFWESMPPYELAVLHFGIDTTKTPTTIPGAFKIERRSEMPFEQEIYYSEAPMTTENHLGVLQRFERVCLEKFP